MNIKDILNQLDWKEKDALYRELRCGYVREDVVDRLNERELDFTESELETIVRKYVYEGDYDCNLSYWTNIDNLIDEVIDVKKEQTQNFRIEPNDTTFVASDFTTWEPYTYVENTNEPEIDDDIDI